MMRNANFLWLKKVLVLFFVMANFGVNAQESKDLPTPHIKLGIAEVSGSIKNIKLSDSIKNITITFRPFNPISGEYGEYVLNLDEKNYFSGDIPLETTNSIVGFIVKTGTDYLGNGMAGLSQNKPLNLNLIFNDDGSINAVYMSGGMELNVPDLNNISIAVGRFMEKNTWGEYHKMTPKEYAEYELNVNLKKRISFAIDSLNFSETIKNHLISNFNLLYLKGRLFFYKESAEDSHRAAKDTTTYTALEPDKSYYSFLKKINLNDSQLLYTYFYHEFMYKFLSINALKIPLIKDVPINNWVSEVQKNIREVVGFDKGLFYDMLAVYAYTNQINNHTTPFSVKQIENIKSYFKTRNNGIVEILLAKNKSLINTLAKNNDLKINETPLVKQEDLMKTIISQYKGKVVLVDFWATWCGPCIQATREIRAIKEELKRKDTAFIYITNASSPKKTWEAQIKLIGGEQYYITGEKWEKLMNEFNFESIPSYLIFDRNGVLKHKFTGFPGIDKMKEMLESI